jgi:molecular chaperone DnaK (HSP70)
VLTSTAKELKEILSRNYRNRGMKDAIPVRINDLPGKTSLDISLSYDDLKNITMDEIFNRLNWLLLKEDETQGHRPLLGRKGIKPDDITAVILAGGSSQLPWLKDEILPRIFPYLAKKKRIILLRNPEMAVAYGAALFAYDTLNEGKHKLPRYMMKDLRVELQNGDAYPLVERGTRLPIKSDSYKAFHSFKFPATGNKLTVNLVEGNEHRAAQCKPLSYKEKTIEFDGEIKGNTLMQLRVDINIKGEIVLEIGKVGLAPKKYKLIYNSLETSTKVEEK